MYFPMSIWLDRWCHEASEAVPIDWAGRAALWRFKLNALWGQKGWRDGDGPVTWANDPCLAQSGRNWAIEIRPWTVDCILAPAFLKQ